MSQQSESNTRMSRTKMQLIFLCKFTSNLLAEAITLTMCRCPNLAAALLNRVNLRRLRGSLFKDPWIKFSPILRTIDSLCMELFGQRSNWLAHSTKARSFYDLCLKWSLEKNLAFCLMGKRSGKPFTPFLKISMVVSFSKWIVRWVNCVLFQDHELSKKWWKN